MTTKAERLSNLFSEIPPEGRAQTIRFVHQVMHDLRTPLNTLMMERYNLEQGIVEIRESTMDGRPLTHAQLDVLSDGCSDLEAATIGLRDILKNLESLLSSSPAS